MLMTKKTQELYERVLSVLNEYPGEQLSATEVHYRLAKVGIKSSFANLRRIEKLLWIAAKDFKVSVVWKVGSGPHFVRIYK